MIENWVNQKLRISSIGADSGSKRKHEDCLGS